MTRREEAAQMRAAGKTLKEIGDALARERAAAAEAQVTGLSSLVAQGTTLAEQMAGDALTADQRADACRRVAEIRQRMSRLLSGG